MADNTAEIALLRKILNSGTGRVTVDGETVQYDLEAARKRLNELVATDDTETVKRPRASSIDLSGF